MDSITLGISTLLATTLDQPASSTSTTAGLPCSDEVCQVPRVRTDSSSSDGSYHTCSTTSDRYYSYAEDIESQLARGVQNSTSLDILPNNSPEFSIKVPQWAYGTAVISLIIAYISTTSSSFMWFSFILTTSIDFVYVLFAATLRYFFALYPRTLATGEPFTFRTYFSVCGFTSASQDDNRLRLPPIVFMVLLALIFFLDAMIRDLPPSPSSPFLMTLLQIMVRVMRELMVGSIRNFLPLVADPQRDIYSRLGRFLFPVAYLAAVTAGVLSLVLLE